MSESFGLEKVHIAEEEERGWEKKLQNLLEEKR